jgi:transposase
MVARETEAAILRLYHAEQWTLGTIARQLGVHHTVVQRVLAQAGIPSARLLTRPTLADPYVPFLVETLTKYPTLRASRLYDMVRSRGYPGRPDHFRAVVARYRPRPAAEAYLRLRTLPGEQAQVDWGHFGTHSVGRARRALMGFVMVLSYSRQLCLHFFYGSPMANFLRGHVAAFAAFGGVARVLLYDNLRSAVLERRADAIRFHPTLLELAGHYRFEPRPVAVARGNEKGRVERAIRFIRDRFFAARPFTDLADLNRQAAEWCQTIAADRPCPEDPSRSVRAVFAEEQPLLLALPPEPFPADEHVEVAVGKTPYVRFDLNDYSVPPTFVRRTLTVHATLDTVRVLDGASVVATHARRWDRGAQIEDEAHVAELRAAKHAARQHRGLDRLRAGAPASARLFVELATRGLNLGAATRQLLDLLDRFGATALEAAITEALARGTAHPASVRQLLDQRRAAAHQPPPVALALPDDPRIRDLVVHPHPLEHYDRLHPDEDAADE